MNEIVKYNNYMNQLNFRGFTSIDMNVLMTLCNKMKNKNVECVTFSFDELKKLIRYKQTSNKQFINDIKRMNDKLQRVACSLETEDEIISFILFPTYRINKINGTLTVSVNRDFQFILNNLVNNFTRFELQEFVELDSKYSKSLYRLLKQWRNTGKMIVNNIIEFREKLDCPKSYTNGIFVRDIINPSIKELQKVFKNLKYNPIYTRKRGKPLSGFEFIFDKEIVPEQIKEQNSMKNLPKCMKNKNNFNNFPQRNYSKEDLEEMEKRLLNKKG